MAILCPMTKAVYLDSSESSISRPTGYFKPLHVDCSVEYELPSSAKPPSHNSSENGRREPLLMIHPSYYRREESRHRDPFIINLPTKLRSLEDWKTPTKTTKSRSTVSASRNSQNRKRALDLSPSTLCSSASRCTCGKSHNRPLPPSFTLSSKSKDGCPYGQVHQIMTMEPIDATMWSNCGVTIEDLRTDKRLITSAAVIDSVRAKSDRNNNDCIKGDMNDKFRKLRRLQTYFEAKGSASKGVAAPNSSVFATMAHGIQNHEISATQSSGNVYNVPVERSKKDAFGISSSFEPCPDSYSRHHPLTLYEHQPAISAATPTVVPMASHWNCGGYYRTAGTNAISTIVRGSENMWRLFQCVTPRLGAQILLITLLFLSGHWWLSLSNVPLLFWYMFEKIILPKNNSGVYDLLEIYSRNGIQKHMMKSLINISWLLIALSFNMYFAMQALLSDDELQELPVRWNNTEY